MKRWYRMLTIITLIAALGGLLLTLTLESGVGLRGVLSRSFLIAAMAGLVISAVLRPQAQRAGVAEQVQTVSESVRSGCTFKDVAANESALKSLRLLKDYLDDPARYTRCGARMPRGVLLYGPPGTGKTLLAKALAGEAGVPFFALSGSDFVEKYVGVGASRVRDLFKKARKAGKCVIFIDEIDAMGKRRDDTSSDERDQTLNALLSEMSGFHTLDGVVVIAATNRVEALDPALLRPGRFDRQIEVGMPDRTSRLSILKLHAANKPIDPTADFSEIASQTVGFSGASLENLMNDAALEAAARGDNAITQEHVERAFYKAVAGEDKPGLVSADERRVIAIHEAGHALISRLLLPNNRLARVSILPAGHGAAGYNLCIPEERALFDRQDVESQICVLLAGRAAESIAFDEEKVTSGASNDLARAAELTAGMVMDLAMNGEPAVSLRALNRYCGAGIDSSNLCREKLNTLFSRTTALLSAHRMALDALADALLAEEVLNGAEACAIIDRYMSNESQNSA